MSNREAINEVASDYENIEGLKVKADNNHTENPRSHSLDVPRKIKR